jgi:hypothetical protein
MEQVPTLIIHKGMTTARRVTRELLDSKPKIRDFKSRESSKTKQRKLEG